MFSIDQIPTSSPIISNINIPTANNIALDFLIYLSVDEINFDNESVQRKEYILHDYLTHEIGLNFFSDIINPHTIRFTFGVQEINDTIDLDLNKAITPQIESLIIMHEGTSKKIMNSY